MNQEKPTRIRIIELLEKQDSLTATEIQQRLNLTYGSTQRLLKKMRKDREINYDFQDNKFIYYPKSLGKAIRTSALAILLCIPFVLFLLPLVSAESEFKWDTFETGDVELYVTCKVDFGTEEKFCDAQTTCNITALIDPDFATTLSNAVMTKKTDGYYNYTTSLTTVGDYIMKSRCTNTSLISVDTKKIRIVDKLLTDKIDELNVSINLTIKKDLARDIWNFGLGSNKSANETLTDVYNATKGLDDIGLLLGSFFASGLFIFFAVRQNGNGNGRGQMPLKILFFIASMLALILGLNLTRAVAVENNAGSNIVKLINTSYVVLIWVFFIAFALFIIYIIAQYIHEQKLIKEYEEEGLE
jgi:hypothetical protein